MRAHRLSGNLLLAALSFGICLVLAEAALRLVLPAPSWWRYPQERYESDPDLGHRLRPDQEAFTHGEPVRTNSLGLRAPEPGPRLPEERLVLALGDSQTFGNGLALEDTWPAQLERELNRRSPDGSWRVVNAGIPATSTWHHEILLERLLPAYQPDAIVLGFYVNDVSRRHDHPPFDIRPPPAWRRRLELWAKRLLLVNLVRRGVRTAATLWEKDRGKEYERHLLAGRPFPRIDEGWEQVDGSLGEMRRAAHALPFLILRIPRRDEVSGHVDGSAYYDRLEGIASRHGIQVVDLLPALQSAYRDHGADLFIPWDGHNSALANPILAEQAAATLANEPRRMRSALGARAN